MKQITKSSWKEIKENSILRLVVYCFLFTTLSGALRKWFINSSALGNLVLGIQMIIPFTFLFINGAKTFSFKDRNFFVMLTTYLFILVLLAANPNGHSVYHGIFGIVLHGGFWVGILTYLRMNYKFPLEKAIPFFMIICVGQIVLASIQSQLPSDAFLNRYAVQEGLGAADALVGDAVRVTGTFSYISGFGSFMIFYTLLVCVLIKIRYNPSYLIPFIALGYYGCLLSGSRGTTYSYPIIIGVFILTSVNVKANAKLIGGTVMIVVLGSFFNFILNDPLNIYDKFSESLSNFETRDNNADDSNVDRIVSVFDEVINLDFEYEFIGVGLGSTYQGANALFGYNPLLYNQGYEAEFKRIILEGGYLLFLLRLIMFLYLVTLLRANWVFKALMVIIILFGATIIYNIFTSFYMMLGLMLIDRVNRLSLEDKHKLY